MYNHANLTVFKPGCSAKTKTMTQEHECAAPFTSLHVSSSFDCETAGLVSSQHRMFERENNSCKSPALSLGVTPVLLSCAACCPCTNMLPVRVRSIRALCNIFHLSSSRSATALWGQSLVNTNHIYFGPLSSFLLFGFHLSSVSFSLKLVIKLRC